MPIGLVLPFTVATGSLGGLESTRNEIDAIKSNLLSLLSTNWGERLNHYHFGCNFIEFIFENFGGKIDTKNRISDRIQDQIATWMPFISLDILNIFFTEDDPSVPEQAFRISIGFRIKSRPDLSSVLVFTASP